jgi:hypothetical protein
MGKNKAPVVITRKDKRLNKPGHLLAFALSCGTSGVYTAAKAGSNAAYNARTRKLIAEAEEAGQSQESPPGHSDMLAAAAEEAARDVLAKGTPRSKLGPRANGL